MHAVSSLRCRQSQVAASSVALLLSPLLIAVLFAFAVIAVATAIGATQPAELLAPFRWVDAPGLA